MQIFCILGLLFTTGVLYGAGTRGFMAPEVLSGQAKPSPASDMFAFGVLLLNTVCPADGVGDYPLMDPSKVADPALKAVVSRLMGRDPASRPTAAQLQAEPYFASDRVDEWGRVDVGPHASQEQSCRQAMLDADADALGVPEIARIVAEIDSRMRTLCVAGIVMDEWETNRRFTVFLYTIQSKAFSKFNEALRERPPGALFDAWRPFLWHLMEVLRSLPDIRRTVYRGIDTNNPRYQGPPLSDYKMSSKIHWSGFSSTSIEPRVARDGFGGAGGVVFVLQVGGALSASPLAPMAVCVCVCVCMCVCVPSLSCKLAFCCSQVQNAKDIQPCLPPRKRFRSEPSGLPHMSLPNFP
jgi:hypothetical protein